MMTQTAVKQEQDLGSLIDLYLTSCRIEGNIKVPQKVIQPSCQENILRLLALCDPNTHKGARDHALILTLLDTGLRAGELANLQLEDIDFPSQRIHVRHGKGNKQRVVRSAQPTV